VIALTARFTLITAWFLHIVGYNVEDPMMNMEVHIAGEDNEEDDESCTIS
jgi:hypothetical protein